MIILPEVLKVLVQIESGIKIVERCADRRKLVQQAAFVLPWFNGVLLTRQPVADRDFHTRLPNPIPQFGG